MTKEAKEKLPITACKEDVPKLLRDPICYDGVWINSWDLANPDFWDCGAKPLDIESPICNHETGRWEKERHENTEDLATCGEVPITDDYVVCDYVTKAWVKFQALKNVDFEICGHKPAEVGSSMCNHATGKWEVIGSVHAPVKSPCGDIPVGMSDQAVCDAQTGEWKEIVQVKAPEPAFKTCTGVPPNVKYPVCNVQTGEWFPLDAGEFDAP